MRRVKDHVKIVSWANIPDDLSMTTLPEHLTSWRESALTCGGQLELDLTGENNS
jgi:hypothetical protein